METTLGRVILARHTERDATLVLVGRGGVPDEDLAKRVTPKGCDIVQGLEASGDDGVTVVETLPSERERFHLRLKALFPGRTVGITRGAVRCDDDDAPAEIVLFTVAPSPRRGTGALRGLRRFRWFGAVTTGGLVMAALASYEPAAATPSELSDTTPNEPSDTTQGEPSVAELSPAVTSGVSEPRTRGAPSLVHRSDPNPTTTRREQLGGTSSPPPPLASPTPTPTLAPPQSERPQPCGEWEALERQAVLGQLGGKVEACIRGALASEDGRLDSSTRQALSRLLIVQADHGDRTKLLGALAWHLEHVSRGDADVSSRYALLLPEEPPEAVVEWCTRALEVLPRELEGDAYLTRRDALLARIARASTRIWIHTEARFQADRSDVNEALEREARANAKGSALEWRDFREAAGIPDKHEALALFNSANGHAEGGETR